MWWKIIIIWIRTALSIIQVFNRNLQNVIWVIDVQALYVIIYYAWIILISLCCRYIRLGYKLDFSFILTAVAMLN